jgi:hypothetical protein
LGSLGWGWLDLPWDGIFALCWLGFSLGCLGFGLRLAWLGLVSFGLASLGLAWLGFCWLGLGLLRLDWLRLASAGLAWAWTGSIYLFMDHLIMLSIVHTIGCDMVE